MVLIVRSVNEFKGARSVVFHANRDRRRNWGAFEGWILIERNMEKVD